MVSPMLDVFCHCLKCKRALFYGGHRRGYFDVDPHGVPDTIHFVFEDRLFEDSFLVHDEGVYCRCLNVLGCVYVTPDTEAYYSHTGMRYFGICQSSMEFHVIPGSALDTLLRAGPTGRIPVANSETHGEGTSHAAEPGHVPLQIEDNADEIIGPNIRSEPITARLPEFVFFEDANGRLIRIAAVDLGFEVVPQDVNAAAAPIGRPWRDANVSVAVEDPMAADIPPLVIELDSDSDADMDVPPPTE